MPFLTQAIFILFISLTSVLASTKQMPTVVSAGWLKENINNTNLRIIDLRTKKEYDKGHIKNAVNIYAFDNLFAKGAFMPSLETLRTLFSEAGIDSQTKVVAYDDGSFIWSARLFWILETLGHNEVGILKIGYSHKNIQQLPLSTTAYTPPQKEFIPRVDNEKLETKLGTLVSIGKKTIIDGRKKSHYLGHKSEAKRHGHIPTAKNYACTQNYEVSDNGAQMKDFSTLKQQYQQIPKDKEIILYCDGGAEAALNYLVLQELGYKASVYDGSWFEWGNDPNVPIENPAKKEQ